MSKSEMLLELGKLIRNVGLLRAEMITEGMNEDADSLKTVELDLIWQYKNVSKFEEV